jgi:hypothetical protein
VKRSFTSSDSDASDSCSNSDNDSGYNSTADRDAKAEYYRQKKAEFKAAGPTLSNLSDAAQKEVKAEERKWEL